MSASSPTEVVILPLPPGLSEDDFWLVQRGSLNASIVFAVVLAIVVWDYIIHIPDEFHLYRTKHVWRRPAPWAFIALRYSVLLPSITALFFTALPTSHCELASAISWTGAILVTAAGGFIFAIRAVIVWSYNKLVLAIVGVAYIFMITCWIAVAAQVKVVTGPPVPLFSNCRQLSIPSTSSLSFASSVLFDLIVLVLTLARVPRPATNKSILSGPGLSSLLYRDGVCYFVGAAAINITVLSVESMNSNSLRIQLLKPLFIPFSTAFTAIIGSRVYLHLRYFTERSPSAAWSSQPQEGRNNDRPRHNIHLHSMADSMYKGKSDLSISTSMDGTLPPVLDIRPEFTSNVQHGDHDGPFRCPV